MLTKPLVCSLQVFIGLPRPKLKSIIPCCHGNLFEPRKSGSTNRSPFYEGGMLQLDALHVYNYVTSGGDGTPLRTWSIGSILNAIAGGVIPWRTSWTPVGGLFGTPCCFTDVEHPPFISDFDVDGALFEWPEVICVRAASISRYHANTSLSPEDWSARFPLWRDKSDWPERVEPNEFDVKITVSASGSKNRAPEATYRLVAIGCHIGSGGSFRGGHWIGKLRLRSKGWFLADDLGGRSHKLRPQPTTHRDDRDVFFVYVKV